jgi:hypothetical protein
VIVVIANGGGSWIEPTAPMAALSPVAAVDGSGNDGVFTTTYYDDDQHPCHHHPHLKYMEHVVTTMIEISAVMTGRECSRGYEIWLMLVCKKCKVTFWKERVYIQGNYWDKDVQWTKGY